MNSELFFTPLFTELSPTVTALVTRRGFNLCHYAPGSDLAEVERCRHELAVRFGVGDDRLFVPTQTHSARVAMPGDDLDGADAIVTDRRRHALVINTADCLPLLLADPEAGVIGAAHCGWRGTVAGIAVRTLERMISLGASADRICVAMG
ncbi:MAG: polyphenol oxidase family protein, partial [Muribaculaceae bacterium]|nr:polyphenol oxidase family protein [Muribaculaceae bacterium]